MEQINNFIYSLKSITKEQIISIIIAIVIAIIFKILSSVLSYWIIKILKLNGREKIKNSSFYNPLKGFFVLLGIYLSIMFLKIPLNINESLIKYINIIFRIILIIITAKGCNQALTSRQGIVVKLKNKMNHVEDRNISNNSIELLLKILKTIIYIIAGILIIQELGFDLKALIAGLGIGGVIITLAAQDTAKNLFGGVVILLDRPFKVGDYVQLLNYEGTVESITFRSTSIRTPDDSVLHIPNSEISSATITNWNELNKRRYKTSIELTLETPLEKVEEIKTQIEKMLSSEEKVYNNTISVKFQNILDNGIEIVVIAYLDITNYNEYLNLKEKINYNIMKILEKNGVKLAYKTQTIYVKN